MNTDTKYGQTLTALLGITLVIGLAVASSTALAGVSADSRSPQSETVNPGDTVDVSVEVTIDNGDNLTVITTGIQQEANEEQFAGFSSVQSSEPGEDNATQSGASYDYTPEVDGSSPTTVTYSYTVKVASDADPGTYTLEGSAIVNTSGGSTLVAGTGTTDITVESNTPTATPTATPTPTPTPEPGYSADRTPVDATVEQGDSVSVEVDLTAGENDFESYDEAVRSDSGPFTFSNIDTAPGFRNKQDDGGGFTVVYDPAQSSDTVTYDLDVDEDAPLGTYKIDGTATTTAKDEQPAGTTTVEVVDDSPPTVDRTPESVSANPGDTVTVEIDVSSTEGDLEGFDEATQDGSGPFSFTNIDSAPGTTLNDNDGSSFTVAYDSAQSSDTISYDLVISDSAPSGTYTLEGTVITSEGEQDAGTTALEISEEDTSTPTPTPDDDDSDIGVVDDDDDDTTPTEQTPTPTPTASGADISLLSASVDDGPYEVGDEIEVSGTFENTGSSDGEIEVVLRSEGTEVTTETITVEAGSTRTVSETLTAANPGTYELTLNGDLAGEVTIEESDDDPTPTTAEPDDDTATTATEDDGPGFGAAIAIIALLGAALLAFRRR